MSWLRRFLIWLGHEVSYTEYIHSEAWAERSRERRKANPRCSLCNRSYKLHVHHRTYERLGRERDEDLVVVCSRCHKLFHDNYTYHPKGFFIPKEVE